MSPLFGKERYKCAAKKGKKDCYGCKPNSFFLCNEWRKELPWYNRFRMNFPALLPLIIFEIVAIPLYLVVIPYFTSTILDVPPNLLSNLDSARSLLPIFIFGYPLAYSLLIYYSKKHWKDA